MKHMRALPHGEVAAAIRAVNGSGATPAVKLAFEFLVLTAERSGEVRGATWTEIDLPARVWTIPARRMKSRRDHRVPLCGRAGDGDSRGGATARLRRQPAGIPESWGQTDQHHTAAADPVEREGRRRPTWVPVVVSGLGGRRDRPSAGGSRGGAGVRGGQPDGGCLCAVGPVRAEKAADGRVGELSR